VLVLLQQPFISEFHTMIGFRSAPVLCRHCLPAISHIRQKFWPNCEVLQMFYAWFWFESCFSGNNCRCLKRLTWGISQRVYPSHNRHSLRLSVRQQKEQLLPSHNCSNWLYALCQGRSNFFSMRATYKMNKSKWSTYCKNAKHIFINKYIENSFTMDCMLM